MQENVMENKNNQEENQKPSWEEIREKRNEEMKEISEKLEKGVKDVFQGENFKKYLDVCSRLPRYSLNNQLLIMMQRPDATMCQSFTGWKEMNRFVKKGEKGIRILAPSPYKVEREQEKLDENGKQILDKDGEPVKEKVEVTVNAFKPVSTFDVSQTDGEPIPSLGVDELTGSVEGYDDLLNAIEQVSPVPVKLENIESGAKGYFSDAEKKIAIQEGMSEAQTVKTAIHEVSHATLHSKEVMDKSGEKKSRNQKECEAESVAYVVCQHYGIDTSDYSFGYVAGWSSDKEVPELKDALETIRRTAGTMIYKIDTKLQELRQNMDIDKFVEQMGDEFPFDSPEVNQPEGYIKIEPPVDMSILEGKSKALEIKAEVPEADKKDEKEPKEKQKSSVKDLLAGKKEKKQKEAKPKKVDEKKLGETI